MQSPQQEVSLDMVHFKSPIQSIVQEEEEEPAEEVQQQYPPEEEVEEHITIPAHKRKSRPQGERVECLKCHKPAVRYSGSPNKDGSAPIIYEHRDEPPLTYYRYKDKLVAKYRRCTAGTSVDAMKVISDAGKEPEESYQVEEIVQQQQQEPEPEASNTIVDVPRSPPHYSIKKSDFNPPDKIRYDKPLPGSHSHRPSGQEIFKMLKAVRTEQQSIRDDQKKILKSMNAIQSILEMMIKGDLVLTPKSIGGGNTGVG